MNPMKTTTKLGGLTVIAMVALASAAGAQTTQPPVLSTVPTPSPGASAHPAQMSGLPLQVGDLPPGIVTVRVIRASFAENVEKQKVELQLVASGESREAVTSRDGRAEFRGLQVGQTVKARAVAEGEALESQPFVLPSEGGVRLVLVAGSGVAAPAWAPTTDYPAGPVSAREQTARQSGTTDWTALAPIFFALVTTGAARLWLWPARRSTEAERARPSIPQSQEPRDQLLESLFQLERDHDAMHISGESYATRRRELMDEITSLEIATEPH